ncbi:MAG: sugar-transfer associated ATP-grasp domain-containing protein [Erysipelotrichaceae bacterium]
MENKLTVIKTADLLHKKTGRSFIAVFLDIVRSYFEYSSTFENYLDFNFIEKDTDLRRIYVTYKINQNYIRKNTVKTLNRKDFFKKYSPTFDYTFIDECDEFLLKHKDFIASSTDGSTKVNICQDSYISKEAMIHDLKERSLTIFEEIIDQNKAFTSLSSSYSNIRIYMAKNEKETSVIDSCLITGTNDSFICHIDNGIISKPAIGKDHNSYKKNPDTNYMFIGLKIPMYTEIIQRAKELMNKEDNKYLSFDFIVSKDSFYLYDVSYAPDICIMQNTYFETEPLREKMDEIFNSERNKYTPLIKTLFVLSLDIFISLFFNLPFVFMAEFILFYLLVYRNIDTRKFYKTCLLSFGLSFLLMLILNVILPLSLNTEILGSDLFVLTLIYLIYISLVYALLSVLISIVVNYLVYPFLNGIMENQHKNRQLVILLLTVLITIITAVIVLRG